MTAAAKHKVLKKELSLINVYAIATGTTLSAGFFLLPGLAAKQAGPAMILSYLIAAIPLVPTMFCMIELATAMPRAGGAYYFLDRSLGPLAGTIGGIGTWLSLVLKSAFALIGMGAYLSLFISGDIMIPVALGFALFFGVVNLLGAKEIGLLQVIMVAAILVLLAGFIGTGIWELQPANFENFFMAGSTNILATAGLVYISYAGITKVTSVAEEVADPEKNLTRGMLLAFATALVVYVLGTIVMVGVVPINDLSKSLTPVALAAQNIVGHWGTVLVTIAAVLAFFSMTNAGILSASRYPLAMSRDHLLPRQFRSLTKSGIPYVSVLFTVGVIMLIILFLNPLKIAKLASAFQLLVFAFCCGAVIIMRESRIEAYDPGFRSPLYPWMSIVGIVSSAWLIIEMGITPTLFSAGLVVAGTAWFFYYARHRVERGGAILHVFERLGQNRHLGLDAELRGILKEKGLRDQDPFEEIIAQAQVIDLIERESFEGVIKQAAMMLSTKLSHPVDQIEKEFLDGTKVGGTPVSGGVALPHMRLSHIIEPMILMVRAREGVDLEIEEDLWGPHVPQGEIHAIFFLVSPEENPKQHLRILAKIAGRVDDPGFIDEWLACEDEQQLKEVLLRDENFLNIKLRMGTSSEALVNRRIRDIHMPEEALIAIINRDGIPIVPTGSKMLHEGDRLTIIGDKKGIAEFRRLYM
ncbi:MAG: amino acid permease [Candidatus Omnitrophica bacterium]|nr:amino acid permease [Candidatus Omnitrophota bacterium]